MITQHNKSNNHKQIILEAEIPSQDLLPEEYDQAQIEKTIVLKDYQLELLNSVGQTGCLIGIQTVFTQYLLSVGSVGLYPVAIALLPTLGSVLTTLTNFSFDGGVQVEDKSKLAGQILRTSALLGNSVKLISDARNMDQIARDSFQVIAQQEREYRNLPEPSKLDLTIPGIAVLLVLVAAIARKRK